MNYLQLCQKLREKAGISGSGPSTVVNQTGEMLRLINWVSEAWEEIQMHRTNWNWMRGDFSFQTVADDYDYTPAQAGIATRFSQWDVDTIKSYRTSIGVSNEYELDELTYSRYRSLYLTGPQPSGTPICFALAPDRKLLIGPKPDGIFTVSGQYWKSPQALSANTDTPEMPSEFHMLIVWKALEMYGWYESAAEVIALAEKKIKYFMNRLEMNQLPDATLPDPLE